MEQCLALRDGGLHAAAEAAEGCGALLVLLSFERIEEVVRPALVGHSKQRIGESSRRLSLVTDGELDDACLNVSTVADELER